MDGQRVGRIVRALRRRRGWRQVDLARAAGCSQTTISFVERGHVGSLSLAALGRVVGAVDASLYLDIRWRGGALERLLDEDHARLTATVADRLSRAGWDVGVEVTYSHFGERGSFDIIAARAEAAVVLAIEVKTELASVETMLRKLDEKARLAGVVAHPRFGWRPRHVGRLVVLPGTNTARRRVARQDALLRRALPTRGTAVRDWLRSPAGPMAGLLFVSDSGAGNGIQRRGGRERVRRPKSLPDTDDAAI